jgi:hypothetical protein
MRLCSLQGHKSNEAELVLVCGTRRLAALRIGGFF